ncbi:hypothetical protein ACIPZF_00620 [Pseudomonas sp. NPDC089752]|uniref:hypothetical protein n=1 Tax=Pseudomonas sp. NPDC089752 TaxID=3364472 RepID=UPI0037FA5A18
MRKQQQFNNSCGAASLLCAAVELQARQLPNVGGSNRGQPLAVTPTCEAALYEITSGALTGGHVKPIIHGALGYSLPHNLAIAARELGLDVAIYIHGRLSSMISTFYPDAEPNCIRAGFTVNHREAPSLAHNQRALKVMISGGVGLHYVMKRSDGTYMDPADGNDFTSFNHMNSWSKMYKFTGITLVLSSPLGAPGA